ncbi:hypothetical protein ACIOEX_26310, partial [Streptomyces sp. NPDC087850]|uniref:hypothetical protein n=1 Tax=Streptomyces sp. NPDC087850 TaxID=3365809 RepID=UPI0037FC5764
GIELGARPAERVHPDGGARQRVGDIEQPHQLHCSGQLFGVLLGLAWRIARRLGRTIGTVDDFITDWNGVDERPGVPERKGVMLRLDGIGERLTAVEHELHPNSGASLRDAVDRVDVALNGSPPTPAE